jgi:hypothetical protein
MKKLAKVVMNFADKKETTALSATASLEERSSIYNRHCDNSLVQ